MCLKKQDGMGWLNFAPDTDEWLVVVKTFVSL
jgi:hypothetical protein